MEMGGLELEPWVLLLLMGETHGGDLSLCLTLGCGTL